MFSFNNYGTVPLHIERSWNSMRPRYIGFFAPMVTDSVGSTPWSWTWSYDYWQHVLVSSSCEFRPCILLHGYFIFLQLCVNWPYCSSGYIHWDLIRHELFWVARVDWFSRIYARRRFIPPLTHAISFSTSTLQSFFRCVSTPCTSTIRKFLPWCWVVS